MLNLNSASFLSLGMPFSLKNLATLGWNMPNFIGGHPNWDNIALSGL